MIRTVFKVGETVTVKLTTQAGTQQRHALASLSGGAIFIEEKSEKAEQPGGVAAQAFTFKFVTPGKVEIQFACYHNNEEVVMEDKLIYFAYIPVEKTAADNINGISTAMGETIHNVDSGIVYLLLHDEFSLEKKKMGIPTWDAYLKVFRNCRFENVPAEIINLIPNMENMSVERIGLFQGKTTGKVYFCTGKKRYYITKPAIFDLVGLDTSKVQSVPDYMIADSFPIDAGLFLP
ncbi:MAG: hypothetical protein RR555_07310 [Bacteroidales bacterium]